MKAVTHHILVVGALAVAAGLTLFMGALIVLSFMRGQQPAIVSTSTQSATDTPTLSVSGSYHNPTYGYTIQYPTGFEVRSITPAYVSIARQGQGASVLDIAVMQEDAPLPNTTFADFAHTSAELTCAFGGPTATIDCSGVSRSQSITTPGGLSGELFYLNQAVRSSVTGSTIAAERGPFFAFNLSPDAKHYSALLLFSPGSLQSQDDQAAVNAMVNSLRLK